MRGFSLLDLPYPAHMSLPQAYPLIHLRSCTYVGVYPDVSTTVLWLSTEYTEEGHSVVIERKVSEVSLMYVDGTIVEQ